MGAQQAGLLGPLVQFVIMDAPSTRRRRLTLALLALLGSLAILVCKHDQKAAWDTAVGRTLAVVAPYAPAELPHAPLLGEPIHGEAVADFEAASEWRGLHGEGEEPPWYEVMAMDKLPADLDARLQPLLPAFDRLAAGAAADRIDERKFLALFLRETNELYTLPPRALPIGTALLTSPALTAARVDLAAGRPEAAVQRTAAVLTLARDQFGIDFGVYDLIAAVHVAVVDQVWNDDRLRSLPASAQKSFAVALGRFDETVAPATRCMFGECARALQVNEQRQRRFCTAADLRAYADALPALPAESAPWAVREPALASFSRASRWTGDLVYIERYRRRAIAQVRLLRMALAMYLGEVMAPLDDPLAHGQIAVTERDGQTVLASRAAFDGKPIERLVKRP